MHHKEKEDHSLCVLRSQLRLYDEQIELSMVLFRNMNQLLSQKGSYAL